MLTPLLVRESTENVCAAAIWAIVMSGFLRDPLDRPGEREVVAPRGEARGRHSRGSAAYTTPQRSARSRSRPARWRCSGRPIGRNRHRAGRLPRLTCVVKRSRRSSAVPGAEEEMLPSLCCSPSRLRWGEWPLAEARSRSQGIMHRQLQGSADRLPPLAQTRMPPGAVSFPAHCRACFRCMSSPTGFKSPADTSRQHRTRIPSVRATTGIYSDRPRPRATRARAGVGKDGRVRAGQATLATAPDL